MAEDLYIFFYGLALLLLSITTVGAMTAMWCMIVLYFKNKESKKHEQQEQEQTAEEKRRKRNQEIIDKYLR